MKLFNMDYLVTDQKLVKSSVFSTLKKNCTWYNKSYFYRLQKSLLLTI